MWELYNTDEDRSESHNLAKEHPEKLQTLIKAWFEEAEKNWVLPLDDRSAVEILGTPRPSDEPPRERYIYYPGSIGVPGICRATRWPSSFPAGDCGSGKSASVWSSSIVSSPDDTREA